MIKIREKYSAINMVCVAWIYEKNNILRTKYKENLDYWSKLQNR